MVYVSRTLVLDYTIAAMMCIRSKKKSDLHAPVFNVNINTIDIVKDYKYLGFNP